MASTDQRFASLDLFRGLTVALMFLVNLPGSFDHIYAPLEHADWHGLTLADLVFPWFLVCVGAAVPLAMDARRAKGVSAAALVRQVLWRSFLLFLLGVALGWIVRPRFTFEEIRIAGVLQRIALVYAAVALLYLWFGARPWLYAVLTAIILAATWVLLALVPVPGLGPPSYEKSVNLFAWLDQEFLPGRVFRKTWDPEGIGGTLPAIASALTGLVVMLALRAARHRLRWLLGAGAMCLALGVAASQVMPINKNLWTSSYVLITAGLGFWLWAALERARGWIAPGFVGHWLTLLGQQALTAYVVHWMLLVLLLQKIGDHWIRTHIFSAVQAAVPLEPHLLSLVFGLLYVAIALAPLPYLRRQGWLIRL
jgi:predicted acyltransferase